MNMRALLAISTICFIFMTATAAHSQQCPARHHWCGPGRGCCPNGEECAPVNGCLGGQRTGVKCGEGHCLLGFSCVKDPDGYERCHPR
jgi:hypothetical protein